MPDPPDDERAELVRLVRDAVDGDKYFLSPRAKRLSAYTSIDRACGWDIARRYSGVPHLVHAGEGVSCDRSRRRSFMPMLPRWPSTLNVNTEIE